MLSVQATGRVWFGRCSILKVPCCRKLYFSFLSSYDYGAGLGAIAILWKYHNTQSTEKWTQPVSKNIVFKQAVRTSMISWCHNQTVLAFSIVPSMALVAKAPTELLQKHGGQCLLRPVRADQSEPTGLHRRFNDAQENQQWFVIY